MESIQSLLNCPICLTKFNRADHEPFMLTCGHNICQNFLNATNKNQEEGQPCKIKCPMCRKISEYQKLQDVQRNLTLLHIIKNFEEQTIIAFVTVKNPVTKAVSILDKMIEDIRIQNEEIDSYFDQLLDYKTKVIEYNTNIIKTLEMFQRYQKDEERVELENHSWKSENQVTDFFAPKVAAIQDQINQFQKFYFKCKEDFATNIHLDLKKNFRKLTEELDSVLNIPEISGIIQLNKNVKTAIDVYSDTQRKYQFSDDYNMDKLLNYLKREANSTADSALTLGFLYDHGIGVEQNDQKAIQYLQRAAQQGHIQANYYMTFKNQTELDFLFHGLFQDYANSFNRIGYFFFRNMLNFDTVKKKIEYLFFKLAADKGSAVGQYNIALDYEEESIDKAAFWAYKAVVQGRHEYKKYVDQIYHETMKFKRKVKDYKICGDYKEFEQQPIILV